MIIILLPLKHKVLWNISKYAVEHDRQILFMSALSVLLPLKQKKDILKCILIFQCNLSHCYTNVLCNENFCIELENHVKKKKKNSVFLIGFRPLDPSDYWHILIDSKQNLFLLSSDSVQLSFYVSIAEWDMYFSSTGVRTPSQHCHLIPPISQLDKWA